MFNVDSTTDVYTFSLHDALPISMLDGMEIKHLIMPRVSLKFHARQRRSEYCALPFLLPHRVKIDGPRISNALDRCGTLRSEERRVGKEWRSRGAREGWKQTKRTM